MEKIKPGPKAGIYGSKRVTSISLSKDVAEKGIEMARKERMSFSAWIERLIVEKARPPG